MLYALCFDTIYIYIHIVYTLLFWVPQPFRDHFSRAILFGRGV